jgi:hypothetical protein
VSVSYANKTVYEWANITLDYERNEKVKNLRRFCENIKAKADKIQTDQIMKDFFVVADELKKASETGPVPKDTIKAIESLAANVKNNFIQNYISFYDILMVNRRGDIVYTIRKENDYGKNLIHGQIRDTPLARAIKSQPRKPVFVDYFYYESSQEPAAFFIEPLYKDSRLLGWFVMQCAINKINSIFAGNYDLGMTGETFLVNDDGLLLTESNFAGNTTILKIKLDDKNVETKLKVKKGNLIVTDYRDQTARTSFEVFDFMGSQWIVVAKLDEGEIITEHFRRHRKFYTKRLLEKLTTGSQNACRNTFTSYDKKKTLVDMDEYVKADQGEVLATVGVATCTAVVATYPEKFGYLAHISPYDKTYSQNPYDRPATNLLASIVKKIKHYDIYQFERRKVKFIIVANHLKSIANIVNLLVDEGFLLDQINVVIRTDARSANLMFDYSKDEIMVDWIMYENTDPEKQDSYECDNVGQIIQKLAEK